MVCPPFGVKNVSQKIASKQKWCEQADKVKYNIEKDKSSKNKAAKKSGRTVENPDSEMRQLWYNRCFMSILKRELWKTSAVAIKITSITQWR